MHSPTVTLSIHQLKLKLRFFPGSLFFMICLWVTEPVKAQTDLEVGPYIGDSYYLGDLNPDVPFRMAQIAYGAMARYNLDDRWSFKLGITRGKVEGNSNNTNFLPGRDLQFESPINDLSVTAEFNFFSYFTGSRWNWITPYLYAGIGVFTFQPESGGKKLQPLGTEGQNVGYDGRKPYKTWGVSIPFGLGIKVSVSKKIGLTAFWEMHKTFTDYIDDVSTTYYLNGPAINQNDVAGALSDPTRNHLPGMQRGNPNNDDWYSFSGLTVSYKFSLKGSRRCKDNKHF
jgi:hypothetical protein